MLNKSKPHFMRLYSLILVFLILFSVLSLNTKVFAKSKDKKNAEYTKLIAITFDDGPGIYTSDLIDRLDERGVKATFFIVGQNAEYYPDVIKKAANSGHQIGNHSYSHPLLTNLSYDSIKQEIDSTDKLLKQADGNKTHYLRPPYGEFNDDVKKAVKAPMINWCVDPEDWKTLDADLVRDAILRDSYDGAIVLCHDIYSTTVDGAIMAIDELLNEGYTFVTVEELLRLRGIKAENGVMYYNALPGEAPLETLVEETKPTATPKPTPEPTPEPTPVPVTYHTEKLSADTFIYKDEELKKVNGLIKAGTDIKVSDDEVDIHSVKTPWGTEGFILSSSLSSEKLVYAEKPYVEETTVTQKRVTKKISTIYKDENLTIPVGIIEGKTEVSVIESGEDSALISDSLGNCGYIKRSSLQNYHSEPFKSVILSIPEYSSLLTDTNLRAESNSTSAILGVLSTGAEVEVIGSDGIWLNVKFGDISGYIRDYTIKRDENSTFDKASLKEDAKLYTSASTKNGSFDSIKSGNNIYILKKSTGDFSLVLSPSGSIGYILTETIEK